MNKVYNATQPNRRPTGKGFKIYMNGTQLAGGFIPAPAKIENLKYIVDGKDIEVLTTGTWTPDRVKPKKSGAGWSI